ncbi:MAG: flippase-like domain-containing protein [Candidatus Nanopelagicales bacterium]|nr:flippase-like domain-containing protein [Candidatus Nanopelagicales bacterium]
MTGPATAPASRRKGGAVGAVLLAVAVVAVGVALWRNWSAVRADLAALRWTDLVGSGMAGAAAVVCTGLAWRVVLAGLGQPVRVRPAMALHTAGQLGKYVPGSVWVVAIQAELGRRLRIPRSVTVLSYLVAVLVAIVTGGLVGLLALTGAGRAEVGGLALALAGVAIVLALAVLRPAAVNAAIRWVATRLRRPLPEVAIPGRALAGAGAWASAGWVCFGLHAWLLARPLGAGIEQLAPLTGAFALAFVAGLLLVPLPAGAGVREAVLVAMLAGSIGAAGALTVGLVSRLVLVVVDVLLAAAFGVRPGRLPAPSGSGSTPT